MKLTLVAYGTWGDVLPITALALGLQERGHNVRLIIPQDFAPIVHGARVSTEFLPLSKHEVMKRVSSETHPVRALLAIRKQIAPALQHAGEFLAALPDDGDAILVNTWLLGIAGSLAESRGQPLIHLVLQPRIKTREIPIPTMPGLPTWFPLVGHYNRVTYGVSGWVQWLLHARTFNSVPIRGSAPTRLTPRRYVSLVQETPSITLVSPLVMPRPADWAAHHRLTGFLYYEDPGWRPDPRLVEFIESGTKPIYVGFGSMHDAHPQTTTRAVVEALVRTDRRAVLHRGWAGLGGNGLPSSVYPLDYAPHSWLLSRVRVAVHHAGAGTSAAALRAGVPSVPVPHSGDQFFWAANLHELGTATEPLKRSRLNATTLAASLDRAALDPEMQRRAYELGRAIREEDGLGLAISAIEDLL